MDEVEQERYDIALLLLYSAERIFTQEKLYEALHNGMSTGFSADPFVIVKIQEFLADKGVLARLRKLITN